MKFYFVSFFTSNSPNIMRPNQQYIDFTIISQNNGIRLAERHSTPCFRYVTVVSIYIVCNILRKAKGQRKNFYISKKSTSIFSKVHKPHCLKIVNRKQWCDIKFIHDFHLSLYIVLKIFQWTVFYRRAFHIKPKSLFYSIVTQYLFL